MLKSFLNGLARKTTIENVRCASVKPTRFVLFLLISMMCLSVNVTGQSESPNLDGTHWKGSSTFKVTGGELRSEYDYIFNGRKAYLAWITSNYTNGGLRYDPITRRMINEPSSLRSTLSGKETGTYAVKNTSIVMEFDDHKIEAIVGTNRMGGTITTRSGYQTTWSAVRVSTSIGNTTETPNSSQIFGPWGNYENLHSAIVKVFNDKWDKAGPSNIMSASEIQKIKDDISTDRQSFLPEEFAEVNTLIANGLNRFFNRDIFKTADFRLSRPRATKSVSDASSTTGNADLDAALAKPQLTISEYIRRIYVPVVTRALSRSQ